MTLTSSDLGTLKRDQLLTIWREHFANDPPARLRKELMVPLLAYRMQEREHGGLSQTARQRLRDVTEALNGRRPSGPVAGSTYKPGTRLVRSWKGELHEVTVAEPGFAYRGSTYATLSVIAREITGTRWSGPAFFGLREKAR